MLSGEYYCKVVICPLCPGDDINASKWWTRSSRILTDFTAQRKMLPGSLPKADLLQRKHYALKRPQKANL